MENFTLFLEFSTLCRFLHIFTNSVVFTLKCRFFDCYRIFRFLFFLAMLLFSTEQKEKAFPDNIRKVFYKNHRFSVLFFDQRAKKS